MTTRASAARYARALLDVVLKEGDPEQVERELTEFAGLLGGSAELQKALTNPAVPVSAKRAIVDNLASRMKLSAPLHKLVVMLADRDRLALLPDLEAVYRERLMAHRQVIRAEVTTAVPLTGDRAAELQRRLSAAIGRRVTLTTNVDPGLIGGAVARVGTTVYDGSIATQLERLKERLEQH
jgi:F-type H+-transporting ATPase subunit delta